LPRSLRRALGRKKQWRERAWDLTGRATGRGSARRRPPLPCCRRSPFPWGGRAPRSHAGARALPMSGESAGSLMRMWRRRRRRKAVAEDASVQPCSGTSPDSPLLPAAAATLLAPFLAEPGSPHPAAGARRISPGFAPPPPPRNPALGKLHPQASLAPMRGAAPG